MSKPRLSGAVQSSCLLFPDCRSKMLFVLPVTQCDVPYLSVFGSVDYDKLNHLASHEKDVKKLHYLTLCADAMHRVAGYGPNWQQAHVLGRQQVAIPEGMRDGVMAGIKPLLSSLKTTHPYHPLLPTVEALDWLADCFVQDAPLKLMLHGQAWARLFPRELASMSKHAEWSAFSQQMLERDAPAKI